MEVLEWINRLIGQSQTLSSNLIGAAESLLLVVALVGLASALIFGMVRGDNPIPTLVLYLFLIGGGLFIIRGWPSLIEVVRSGAYRVVELTAGGQGNAARVPAE